MSDYSFNPPPMGGKCRVSMTWLKQGAAAHCINVDVENGDFHGIIDAVRSQGGIYVDGESGKVIFLPWPPAAIEVTPLT